MGKNKKAQFKTNSYDFVESLMVDNRTFIDYLERFKRICLSMFEWQNLPSSMNERYLEECLFYLGQACLLYDEKYGYINTRCSDNGQLNIYGLPTKLNCYSYTYQTYRNLYVGLPPKEELEKAQKEQAILVMNTKERVPTLATMELFAYRLYEAEMTALTNIKAQKTPVLILCDNEQRLTMENLYSQYDGNKPVIFGDKNQLPEGKIKAISTEAPFIADKIMEYKKQIWNEALVFLGVNTLSLEKIF